jgi:hypothetical protein
VCGSSTKLHTAPDSANSGVVISDLVRAQCSIDVLNAALAEVAWECAVCRGRRVGTGRQGTSQVLGEVPVREAVLAAIDGETTVGDVVARVRVGRSVSEQAVYNTLGELVRDGTVIRVRRGVYARQVMP